MIDLERDLNNEKINKKRKKNIYNSAAPHLEVLFYESSHLSFRLKMLYAGRAIISFSFESTYESFEFLAEEKNPKSSRRHNNTRRM